MDANKVWQWRSMHIKTFLRHPEPFYHSNEIGLHFNEASETQKKHDLQLLTNGVMLEICDFAKTVNDNKMRFITNILENNFDLGLENEQHRVYFTDQLENKIKDPSLQDKNEVFTLFDISSKPDCNSNNGLNMASTERKTEGFLVQVDDTDDSENQDAFKCSQATSKEYMKTESLSEKIDGAHGDESEREDELKNPGALSAEELKEDVLPSLFPYCEGIGLNLDIGTKQSLDQGLLTNGVMLELLHVTKILSPSFRRIVFDVLGHNFQLDLKSPQEKNRVFSKIANLLKKRKQLMIISEVSPEFKNEPFSFQTKRRQSDLKSKQEKRALLTTSESVNKRSRRGQSKGNEFDMEQEKMGTEKNMWKLRANRVKQILSSLEFGSFKKSKRFGLEFDVGFGPKQNFNVDSLPNSVLLEVAKFALALNSSQQNFIMEILEYNFDISLQSGDERNSFTCEIMNRVRQLKNSEDAVKFSKDIFELPDPMSSIKMANTRVGSVKPEVGYNISRGEECDVAPGPPAHSHAETKDHISRNSVDVYPICKEIGLKLHVNKRQPSKRLDISTLTNGAMTEVTNFAEKLCGTSEQICLDILRHNLDLDLQSGDSDLAGSIVARIPAIVEQRNLVASLKLLKKRKGTRKDSSEKVELDCQSQHKVDACSAGSSQATDPHVGNSPDTENQNALNLKLWKLRTNQIKQILSIPHEKHCPLYSYSRCQKLGLDFNVGSGVKQNLDPKLLTNGIMVELNTFATALLSAQKHFITEILEYNFHLDFKNELHRSAFAQQTLEKVKVDADKRTSVPQMKMRFELPDLRYPQDTAYEKPTYCPKCVQDQNQELDQDESDPCDQVPIQPHTITDAVTADANCTAQKPSKDLSSNFSAIEETIMDSYPRCKEIGLSLCVNKDQPRKKLDTHVLTRGAMIDVASFAKKLCATNSGIIHAVLEHNFNLGMQIRDVDIAQLFRKATALKDDELAWFDKVLVIQPSSRKQPGRVSKLKRAAAMQKSEWKDTIKKRKLSPQTKMKRATLKSHKVNDVKSNSNRQSKGSRFPICSEMTLDVEVSSKPGKRKILDMKLLTRGVCDMEQEEMETGNNYSCPLGEFDVDSNNVTHSGNADNQDHLQNPKICPMSSDISRESKSSCPGICAPILTTVDISSPLSTVNSNVNPPFASQPDESTLCGDEEQTQTPRKLSNECNIQQEKMGTENNFNFPLGESDQGADTGNEFDMEQEKMGTEKNMWKLRANRVEQILSSLELGPFNMSKKVGLEFDVGFGPKQNFSVDSLPNSVLLEVAKFALALNSSQQDFIMEILEYNFDISLQSEYQRSIFTCEIMKRVGQLKNSEDAVKFSKDIFEFPGRMQLIYLVNQRNKECEVAPERPAHSHAETKDHISRNSVDVYHICKEIGLRWHVNKRQPNKRLDISKLTNEAMTEVTNFAETLCGTFEQIYLDILRHNLDLGLESGDSDLAGSIVARIPAIVEQRNLVASLKLLKRRQGTRKDYSKKVQLDCQSQHKVDACSADSSQAQFKEKDVGNSPDTEKQNTLKLKLWKFRANQIQQTLSIPHEEHCPLYSYSRCKKLGLDFNVGSGVKQNLDPKLLTNGIMVELNTFATALLSAQKHFITEILEYNFNLDFKTELHRSAFAQHTMEAIRVILHKKSSIPQMKMRFKLPDMRYLQDSTDSETAYCPKCNQVRSHKLRQDEPDPCDQGPIQPHTITDTVTADANCTAQKPSKDPSSDFSAIEEKVMDSYPHCKKIGLSLYVDKDQPRKKLDTHVLTRGVMNEVASFAKKLCATKSRIIHAVLEHNFNLGMQMRDVDIAQLFRRTTALKDDGLAWFDEVFVNQPASHKQPGDIIKLKRAAAIQKREWKKAIKKTKLALQTKMKRATLRSHEINDVKSNSNCQGKGIRFPICSEMTLDVDVSSKPSKRKRDMEEEMEAENDYTCPLGESDLDSDDVTDSGNTENQDHLQNPKIQSQIPSNRFPVCTEIGLDLDLSSKSEEKEKLDLKLLTRAAVCEIHKFATKKSGHYLPHTVYDILDYNFDLSSQNHRRWEFSIATSSKVKAMVRQRSKNRQRPNEVFKLPFVFASKASQFIFKKGLIKKRNKSSREEPYKKKTEGRFVRQVKYHSGVSRIHFLDGVKTICEASQDLLDPGSGHQMNRSLLSVGSGSALQRDQQIKEEYNPHYDYVKLEVDTEEKYCPHYEDVKPDLGTIVQINSSLVSVGCGSPLQRNPQIKEEYDPHYDDVKTDPGTIVQINKSLQTKEEYGPHYDDFKTESNAEDVERLFPGEPSAPLEYTLLTLWPYTESQKTLSDNENVSHVKTEWDTEGVKYLVPLEAVGSQENSMVTIVQGNESTLIAAPQPSENWGLEECLPNDLNYSFHKRQV